MDGVPAPHDRDPTPALLPGLAAHFWMRRRTIAFLVIAVAGLAMILGSALGVPLRYVVVGFAFTTLGTSAAYGMYANVNLVRAIHRELDAGYTTLYGREYARYWQLHWETGAVIRAPGNSDE